MKVRNSLDRQPWDLRWRRGQHEAPPSLKPPVVTWDWRPGIYIRLWLHCAVGVGSPAMLLLSVVII